MQVSLFASAVRPKIWPMLFESLKSSSVDCEVVFAGNVRPLQGWDILKLANGKTIKFAWIETANIKPAQCYEIARRNCIGETIVWIADDCEFPNDVIGQAYKYWKAQGNEKLILSIQTKESGYGLPNGQLFNMNLHRFHGGNIRTPLMAPLGMMSRRFLDDLGGIDRRYVCGQYENDIVMRALSTGGTVKLFGDNKLFIDIDHLGKSIMIGESKNQNEFLNRPFATGYAKDREVLERSWRQYGNPEAPFFTRDDEFQPYSNENILTVSQSNKGKWS